MTALAVTIEQAQALSQCMTAGGVAVFPTDTVYGLACDPGSGDAVERLYALKGRPEHRPAAVMFFTLSGALEALGELGPRTRSAIETLLPGPLTLLLPNPSHLFPLACGPDPETLGLRVPALPHVLEALAHVRAPLLQSSANDSGGADARTIAAIPRAIRDGADLVVDGGELPGVPSTVLDLRDLEPSGTWSVLREGAVAKADIATSLGDAEPVD